MNFNITDPYELANYIKTAQKSTPIKAYIDGKLQEDDLKSVEYYGKDDFYIVFGEKEIISKLINQNKSTIKKYKLENDRRNSAIPLINLLEVDARIEPGAIIRDKVSIERNAVIMMGAVINIGAEIGEASMIDMNAVIGARGKIGKRVHIGAGAVVAGVLEPPSKEPCEIEDDVLVGANAVILEGVKVGKGAVVAAGAVVTENVPAGVLVAGTPAKIIKNVDDKTKLKTKILEDLRK